MKRWRQRSRTSSQSLTAAVIATARCRIRKWVEVASVWELDVSEFDLEPLLLVDGVLAKVLPLHLTVAPTPWAHGRK